LTVVIVLHELGHMAAYRAFGHQRVRMIFVPLLGGIAVGGRPYNSRFEVAVCALMGAGMPAFLVPPLIALHDAAGRPTGAILLIFLLILGAFNLLNLLPMHRFDGGQVLRQVFSTRRSLLAASFLVTLAIVWVGWRIGLPVGLLMAGLAVFTALSLIGAGGVKPKAALDPMTAPQRLLAGFGLYAAIVLHGYAIVYACDRLLG
jgi:Zn-dependent protease